MARGTGKTTKQMKDAPIGAVYVWVNNHLVYPRQLAKEIGRPDLEIISSGSLDPERFKGRNLTGFILDHALDRFLLTLRQWDAIIEARARIR